MPLAAILTDLDTAGETDGARQTTARWYWCGVLGELYGEAIESRFARDLAEVVEWVKGRREPITVHDAHFTANRLLTLQTRNSAAYKGIYALLMRDGGLDFLKGILNSARTFFDDKIDIHHIFPQAWCKANSLDDHTYNSIINKATISAATNRSTSCKAPSTYLPTLEKRADIDSARLDTILSSRRIEPGLLRADDF